MRNIQYIEDELEKLEIQKTKLVAEKASYNDLTQKQQLAIVLHESLCRNDHAGAVCAWECEDGGFCQRTHQHWLIKATQAAAFAENHDISIQVLKQLVQLLHKISEP